MDDSKAKKPSITAALSSASVVVMQEVLLSWCGRRSTCREVGTGCCQASEPSGLVQSHAPPMRPAHAQQGLADICAIGSELDRGHWEKRQKSPKLADRTSPTQLCRLLKHVAAG